MNSKNKRLVVLVSIFLLSALIFVIALKNTKFFIPTPSGKLVQSNPYNIAKYPNAQDWSIQPQSEKNNSYSITFSSSDSETEVFNWYDTELTKNQWSRVKADNPSNMKIYNLEINDTDYNLYLSKSGTQFSIKIFLTEQIELLPAS